MQRTARRQWTVCSSRQAAVYSYIERTRRSGCDKNSTPDMRAMIWSRYVHQSSHGSDTGVPIGDASAGIKLIQMNESRVIALVAANHNSRYPPRPVLVLNSERDLRVASLI